MNYDDIDEFDRLLVAVIDTIYPKASNLLSVPGIYEILAEELNNDVLDAWDKKKKEIR